MAGANKKKSLHFSYILQLLFAIVGICLSVYLFVQHTRLKNGIQDGASFCTFGKFADCDSVNVSAFSEIGGIPIAALGALAYFLILLLSIAARPSDTAFRFSQRMIAILASVCLGVDLVLFAIQLFALQKLCLLCLGTYVASLGVLWATYRLAGSRSMMFGPTSARLSFSTHTVLWLALGLFGTALYFSQASIRLNSQTYAYVNNAIDQFYEQWPQRPAKLIDIAETDGTFGNPNAKVKIVEFSDFECPFCRKAAFTLHTALTTLGKDALFVFKHFPLDNACNPVLQHPMHPNACGLARLGVCAARKGNFWKYHDLVFFNWESKTEGQMPLDKAVQSGIFKDVLTNEEIQKCLSDETTLAAVQKDIQTGVDVGVKGTPAVYVNGKAVTIPVTLETLKKLIAIENR